MAAKKIRIGESEGCRWAQLSPDATLRLPNASTSGYGKYKAGRGDIVVWQLTTEEGFPTDHCIGRVLGVIEPDATNEDDSCPKYLAVLRLASGGNHAYPMWVNPRDVQECYSPRDGSAAFAAWFFGPELAKEDPSKIMRQSRAGALSIDYFHKRDTYK